MNLSLLAQAVNTFLDGYWPKEVVEDWRYKKLFAANEAALAQEAQPYVCDPTTFHAETHVAAGTQQAQPLTDHERRALKIVADHCAGFLNARNIVYALLDKNQ